MKDLVFQIVDIHCKDTDEGDFQLNIFGKKKSGKSVYLRVDNYKPYFYVYVPKGFDFDDYLDEIRARVHNKHKDGINNIEYVDAQKYTNFMANEKHKFAKLTFTSFKSMKKYIQEFKKKNYVTINLESVEINFELYESNVNPIVQYLICNDIKSAGWIKVDASKLTSIKNNCTDYGFSTEHDCVIAHDCNDMHGFVLASFDIECVGSGDGKFPTPENLSNEIIQIGLSLSKINEPECYKRYLIGSKKIAPINDTVVISCEDEADMLLKFRDVIVKEDPDFITGFNTFLFDFRYIFIRAKNLGIKKEFSKLSRLDGHSCTYVQRKVVGRNKFKYYDIPGRVVFDLMKVIQKEANLDSYSLANVSSTYIRDKVDSIKYVDNTTILTVGDTTGVNSGQFIGIVYNNGLFDEIYKTLEGSKFEIIGMTSKSLTLKGIVNLDELFQKKYKVFWNQTKDDFPHEDMLRYFNGTPEQRAIIGKYCVQDCELCNKLLYKLKYIINYIAVANICIVPISYTFLRGQGVKSHSLVLQECRKRNYLVPDLTKKRKYQKNDDESEDEYDSDDYQTAFQRNIKYKEEDEDEEEEEKINDKYDGAEVLEPKVGLHYDPVTTLDYASLYPSKMCELNLSAETLVIDEKYMNLDGYIYHHVSYNEGDVVVNCVYAEGDVKGILCAILITLLSERKKYKKLMEDEDDDFMKAVLNGVQAGYKVIANSIYGQTGSPVSPIYKKEVASCTTAGGRKALHFAKDFVEVTFRNILDICLGNCEKPINYRKFMLNLFKDTSDKKFKDGREKFIVECETIIKEHLDGFTTCPSIIYGDTDSVFYILNIKSKLTGKAVRDETALVKTIKLGQVASDIVNKILKDPMKLEYEKVMWPFIILKKKKYVGNLYETDPKKYKLKPMGIVLKRRDNAPIVKLVYGGIVDYLLNKRDKSGAIEFLKSTLVEIMYGKFSIDKFVITKTLRDTYADRSRMAHVVLADRVEKRDPGNKFNVNDRIPFVYVKYFDASYGKTKVLQGEKIETIDYVLANGLKIDYGHYIENQIMKPVCQLLDLIVIDAEKFFEDVMEFEKNRTRGFVSLL